MGKLGRFLTTVVAAGTVLGLAALALVPIGGVLGGASHTLALSQPVRLKPLDVPSKVYDTKGNATDKYDVPATSYVVVVDKTGKVVYTGVGGKQDIEKALKKVM